MRIFAIGHFLTLHIVPPLCNYNNFLGFFGPQVMTMMFEVQDLEVASPATVSRCGMVYLEPNILGLTPFTECWLRTIPGIFQSYTDQLNSLFARFLQVICLTVVLLNVLN